MDLEISKLLQGDTHPLKVLAADVAASDRDRCLAEIAWRSCKKLGVPENLAFRWALVCDLFHLSEKTLDDIVEENIFVGSQESQWVRFGRRPAIQLGVLLRSLAHGQLHNLAQPQLSTPLFEAVVRAGRRSLLGQTQLQKLKHSKPGSLWRPLTVALKTKTGTAWQLPLVGALLCAKPEAHRDIWEQTAFMQDFALAAQIHGDCHTLKKHQDSEPPPPPSIFNGSITIPVAWLSLKANSSPWIRKYQKGIVGTYEFATVVQQLHKQIFSQGVLADLRELQESLLGSLSESLTAYGLKGMVATRRDSPAPSPHLSLVRQTTERATNTDSAVEPPIP